ncbi:hypothetical protein PENTCL1PPCAC_6247, partial [Pristionchus entomophagus]
YRMAPVVHKPGPLKQKPKPHKSGSHRTKGQIDRDARGRTKLKGPAQQRKALRAISKEDRRQVSAQNRVSKLKTIIDAKRANASGSVAPTLVTLVTLGGLTSSSDLIGSLAGCDETIVHSKGHNVDYLAVPRFKSRIGFLTPDSTVLDDVLDSIKVSSVLLLVWPLDGEISEWTELLISAILSHGVPSIINVVPGLASINSGKVKETTRRNVEKLIDKWSLSQPRLLHADSQSDGVVLIRTITEAKKKKMVLQKRRGHVYVEKLDMIDEKDGQCTLLATGFIRGPFLNVNRLVHLPGCGDFQLEKIEMREEDPHPLKQRHGMFEPKVLAVADPAKQESLQSEVVPDPMDAEQTWPDEYDAVDAEKLTDGGEKRRVPKGTSSYQAAWIVEDEEEEEGEGEGEESGEDMEDDEDEDDESGDEEADLEGLEADEEEEQEMDDVKGCETATEAPDEDEMEDEDIDMDEVEKYRRERENEKFPDETDTPLDIPARVRFQKYRGLKSFRTSPWDTNENLPFDYARIFKFANFRRTKKLMVASTMDSCAEGAVDAGLYATLHIKNVPVDFAKEWRHSSPLVIYSLLPHENKMCIQNIVIKRHPTCTVPIPSKSKLLFHVGFRRFEVEPVFSQHTNGDKFKMERYLRPDGCTVASFFAPITFAPASTLVFRIDAKGRQELVGAGCVLDNNPDRIMLKRIVLSGHPYKINRRSVVARYMFFNREDIEWFKPVELYTPTGRRGHIKDTIGTHGHMKCRFDQQLNAQDSVMMSLYKRVFPKWTYNPRVGYAEKSRIAARSE